MFHLNACKCQRLEGEAADAAPEMQPELPQESSAPFHPSPPLQICSSNKRLVPEEMHTKWHKAGRNGARNFNQRHAIHYAQRYFWEENVSLLRKRNSRLHVSEGRFCPPKPSWRRINDVQDQGVRCQSPHHSLSAGNSFHANELEGDLKVLRCARRQQINEQLVGVTHCRR